MDRRSENRQPLRLIAQSRQPSNRVISAHTTDIQTSKIQAVKLRAPLVYAHAQIVRLNAQRFANILKGKRALTVAS
jgi:hypothetical protein